MKPLFLIADDSQAKREFLKSFVLKQLEVEVLEAGSTEEAKQKINEHVEIAAAFIDYEIPSEQGPAIIEHLKHHNPNCLVALVSSADNSEYRNKSEAAGAQHYICTSWHLDEVESALTNLLAEWGAVLQNTEI